MRSVAFFGHRRIFKHNEIVVRLMEKLIENVPNGYNNFLIGTYGEFDQLARSCCLKYVREFNSTCEITIIFSSLTALNKYKFGYFNNDFCKTMLYDVENIHYKNRITQLNKKIVDDSDLIICYVDMNKKKSGAKNAVKYAMKKKKRIINLFKEDDWFIDINEYDIKSIFKKLEQLTID